MGFRDGVGRGGEEGKRGGIHSWNFSKKSGMEGRCFEGCCCVGGGGGGGGDLLVEEVWVLLLEEVVVEEEEEEGGKGEEGAVL